MSFDPPYPYTIMVAGKPWSTHLTEIEEVIEHLRVSRCYGVQNARAIDASGRDFTIAVIMHDTTDCPEP